LAFHRYPQLIREFFNTHRSGPPRGFSRASPWPWVDHLVSGLRHATVSPYSDSLSLRLRDSPLNLATYRNSPVRYAKSTRSPRPEGHRAPTACRHTVSGSISLPSRGSFHLSLTVLAGFHVSRTTWERTGQVGQLSSTGLLPSAAHLSRVFRLAADFVTVLCCCGSRSPFPLPPIRNARRL